MNLAAGSSLKKGTRMRQADCVVFIEQANGQRVWGNVQGSGGRVLFNRAKLNLIVEKAITKAAAGKRQKQRELYEPSPGCIKVYPCSSVSVPYDEIPSYEVNLKGAKLLEEPKRLTNHRWLCFASLDTEDNYVLWHAAMLYEFKEHSKIDMQIGLSRSLSEDFTLYPFYPSFTKFLKFII